MNSRSCRWLIALGLLITASGATAQCKSVFGAQNIATLKQQAAHGEAAAQCSLGGMYEDGKGVPQDYAQAALWYRKAAEQGDANAQVLLGFLYREGHGVPQDDAQATAWFHKADEQGNAVARLDLYILYAGEMDRSAPEDYPEAVAWFRKAANQGYDLAQDVLGNLRPFGGARRLNRAMLVRSSKLVFCTTTAWWVCPRTTQKPISGSMSRLLARTPLWRRTLRKFETQSRQS